MKVIKNNLIPLKGFLAINLFGILFVRDNAEISERTIRHESIHTRQMQELLYIVFYLIYIIEWFVRLFMIGNAYRNISFEKEAYENQDNESYLKERKSFAWAKYLMG